MSSSIVLLTIIMVLISSLFLAFEWSGAIKKGAGLIIAMMINAVIMPILAVLAMADPMPTVEGNIGCTLLFEFLIAIVTLLLAEFIHWTFEKASIFVKR